MKILLDECIPLDFRHHFPTHDAHTVQWAGLKSKKNGELLLTAEAAGYEAFLTVDQGIPHQHRFEGRKLAIILVHARTNQMEHLLPLVDSILRVIETIRPGEVVNVF